jgi:hypothetical protein
VLLFFKKEANDADDRMRVSADTEDTTGYSSGALGPLRVHGLRKEIGRPEAGASPGGGDCSEAGPGPAGGDCPSGGPG